MQVRKLTVRRLELPLTVPYRLSLGDIRTFETILVEAEDGDGATGFGEATLLTGYTDETVEESWTCACALAERAAGLEAEDAKAIFAASFDAAPFTVTALTTAVEMLEGHPVLAESGPVPLLGLVNEKDPVAIETEIDARIADGYRTLKVKVGWDVGKDLARVRHIQDAVGGRARIRIDANQGFDRDQAVAFVAGLAPDGIELVEQTCAAGDWDAAVAVKRAAAVPMMLDESIYDLDDIDRAAERGAADYIKLKLMKAGGLSRLATGLQHIRDCGMIPVLGNGVAADLGCWMEACVARWTIDNAGEMNGFLKTPARLLSTPLGMDSGSMLLTGEPRPALAVESLDRHTLRRAAFGPA